MDPDTGSAGMNEYLDLSGGGRKKNEPGGLLRGKGCFRQGGEGGGSPILRRTPSPVG